MTSVVNIRFNSCHSHPLDVDNSWTIEKVKEQIAEKEGLNPTDIRIIFAGKELQNFTYIREIDLGEHSVLHVIRGRKRYLSLQAETTSDEYSHGESANARTEQGTLLSHYFVFCKKNCKKICPGKLRVRCTICKQGSFRLEQKTCYLHVGGKLANLRQQQSQKGSHKTVPTDYSEANKSLHGTFSQEPSGWDDVLKPNKIAGVCEEKHCDGDKAEFYFKCANHSSIEDESSVVLYLVKVNVRHVECITCLSICDPVLVFPCPDGHSMCLDCFRIYCQTKLNDRDFVQHPELGYTLGCPAGCDDSLIDEIHHFRILGEDQYDRYQSFSTEECLLQMGGVLCPQSGCGAGLLPEDNLQRRIECATPQGCGFVFCRRCFLAYHQGACNERMLDSALNTGYSVDPARAERARWERESKDMIEKTTKPCPQCNVPVEKSGGCMHMQCTRCKFEWCWLCHTAWSRECMGNHWFG